MSKIFSPAKHLITPHEQGADFVELFFDLVFVYAITRITSLTADHIDPYHVIQSMLIFWLIWWGWTQFTWTLNAASVWKTSNLILVPRLIILFISSIALALSVGQPSYWALSIIAVSLILVTFIEWKKCQHA